MDLDGRIPNAVTGFDEDTFRDPFNGYFNHMELVSRFLTTELEKSRKFGRKRNKYRTKKLLFEVKLKRVHKMNKIRRKKAELQDRLKIMQMKETTVELVSVVKKTQQEKLRIRVSKKMAKLRELEQLNDRIDSMLLELETEQISKENQRIDKGIDGLCRTLKELSVEVKSEKEQTEFTTVQKMNKTIKDGEKKTEVKEWALKAVEDELT